MTHKRITYGEKAGIMVAEVQDGLKPGPMTFAAKIRYYRNLTPSTMRRLARLCNDRRYIPGATSWGISVQRRLGNNK
jgi:hypothetical protein